jgi:sugar phosphate isomerase/epimerase
MPLRVGINPYGLTYTLGLQGQGTPRVNPLGLGLDGFVAIADTFGAKVLELDWRWLLRLDASALARLGDHGRDRDLTLVVSAWPAHEPGESLEEAVRVSTAVGARLLRLHLTPILEGARAALGERWPPLVKHARDVLLDTAERARRAGLLVGVENHQDFGSEELLDMTAEAGAHVGIVFDTGNPFAVGEDPVAFARRVAPRVFHLHLKDYRAVFTQDGYQLVRCPIGDGAVPFAELLDAVTSRTTELSASIEPGALDARHIRLFRPEWWQGYPVRSASELVTLLDRLKRHRISADVDHRTPWERGATPDEITAYEMNDIRRSFDFVRSLVHPATH